MKRGRRQLDPNRTGREAERLEQELKRRVVGQDEAIGQIVNLYGAYLAGLNHPGRPIGNLLFLGPTGTGKTRLVEATAESLVGSSAAVVKLDCGEFQHSHDVAKLIGSPPGYLGHRETRPALSQEILDQRHTDQVKISFVLFDEIEKASDALWKLMLGILDKGVLTLGDNRKVDFSRTIIFMTSNLGAAEMSAVGRARLGFATPEDRGETDVSSKLSEAGIAAARRKFSPEFMNRIDKVLVFRPLGTAELRRILDLELNAVQERILGAGAERVFVLSVTDAAKAQLLREGTDPVYGARHLKRAVERMLVYPLSNLIASEQVQAGDVVRVNFDARRQRMAFSAEAGGPVRRGSVEERAIRAAA